MCLSGLVKICLIVLKHLAEKELYDLFRCLMTLILDLMNPTVDRYMPLPCGPGPLVSIFIKSG